MTISAGVGPISGINYSALITGLTGVDQVGVNAVTNRSNTLQNQDQALLSLSTLVTQLKISSASFISPAIFKATQATSANPGVINATGGVGTPAGNYNFSVQQLAAASQAVTQGFSSTSSALNLAGTITLQTGGGNLDGVANLRDLNGGSGVARGSIRITDASGASTLVNLNNAVNINDVVTAINSSSGVDVTAKVSGDHLVITDTSGGTGALKIANTGGTTTASDLGLTGTPSGNTLTGSTLTAIGTSTALNSLNDGNGVRTVPGKQDFSITSATGTVNVSLTGANSVADVIKTINTAGASQGISAAVSADGSGFTLTDSGGGPITVAALNGSSAAADLGLTAGTGTGGTLVGNRVANELVGPLLTDLNGGSGTAPQYGTILVNGQTIDLSGARSLQDVIDGINTNTQGVRAALNGSATGITLSSNSGSFTVADGTGNLASFLHVAGTSTATPTGSQITSGNLNLRYISNNTALSSLNGGTGVSAGAIKLTDGFGTSANVDLSTASTVGDVISAINASGLHLTAGLNNAGNGILLTQNGGPNAASVTNVILQKQVGANGVTTVTSAPGGTMASDLGILGTFSSGTLNGSFQKSITVLSTDTLSDIATKINDAGGGVAASIINDGSGTPYRLSLSSRNSGLEGRLIFDGSGAGLTTTSLVKGQDAVVVYGGGANGTGGLLTTNSSNTISGLIPSLTLNLTGVGTTSVSVSSDTSQIATAVQTFVTNYNTVITTIATDTSFDTTNAANTGVLFGNSTVQQLQNALGQFVNKGYSKSIGGSLSGLASIGISVGQDGTLTLDTNALNNLLSTDPTDVQKLFSTNVQAVKADLTKTPPVQGVLRHRLESAPS